MASSSQSAPANPALIRAPEPPLDHRISANTLYLLSQCERRLYLSQHARAEAAPPDEYQLMLRQSGIDHERRVLEKFPDAVGPIWRPGKSIESAAEETRRLLRNTRSTLYQAVLLSPDGARIGIPDFLVWDRERLFIHDAKLLTNLDSHTEVNLQMAHYARLVEDTLGRPPARCEITNGRGEVIVAPASARGELERALERGAQLLGPGEEPDILLAHSTCAECPFYAHCWDRAVEKRRVEILSDVNRRVAPLLHALGIRTVEDLAAREPEQVQGPGIKSTARAMILEARAHRDQCAYWVGDPGLPLGRPRIWFDLEGDPDTNEPLIPIYLWGLAVDDGHAKPRPEAIVADFGGDGDRRAWERFTARAMEIFDRYPECVWVHYASYEKTWVRNYVKRFGAPDGFEAHVDRAFFDLYQAVKRTVRLPLFSYSIKPIAHWLRYHWRNPESGSQWSVIQFYRARDTEDPAARRRILREIIEYNEDDLWAMKKVWEWLERGARGA